jgi:uncharacterized protein YybS (DUF2232 family)
MQKEIAGGGGIFIFGEWILAVGIIISIYYSSTIIFPLGWFLPLPVIVIYLRRGLIAALASIPAACALIFIMNEQPKDLLIQLLVIGGLVGLVTASLIKKGYKVQKITISLIVLPLLLVPGALLLTDSMREKPVKVALEESYDVFMNDFLNTKEESKTKDSEISEYRRLLLNAKKLMIELYPFMFCASIAFGVILSLVLTNKLLDTLELKSNLFRFRDFDTPDIMIGLFVIAGIGVLLLQDTEAFVSLNLLIYTIFIYLLQGFALLHSFMLLFNITGGMRLLLYLSLILLPVLLIAVVALGMLNIWIPMRIKFKDLKDKLTEKSNNF